MEDSALKWLFYAVHNYQLHVALFIQTRPIYRLVIFPYFLKVFSKCLMWFYKVSYRMKISDVDLYFGKIITCLKIENSFFT